MDESEKQKQVRFREPPSVPFLWERRPGLPKVDWKPEPPPSSSSSSSAAASVPEVPKLPTKLVTSIPFAWEEKPGTPIPHFSFNAETKLIDMEPSSSSSNSSSSAEALKLPTKLIASIPFAWEEKPGTPIPHFSLNSEAKLIDMESASSSSSSPSLAYHVAFKENSCDSNFDEGSDVDDDKSSTSSYETGRSSLVGASFLESLFPFFPPKTGFLERAGSSSSTPLEAKENRDFDGEEDNRSAMLRKPPTLGELIMMSRRRSYRRKVVQMSNWDLQRSITKKEAFGCFNFASSCKIIEGLFDKNLFPRLKMM